MKENCTHADTSYCCLSIKRISLTLLIVCVACLISEVSAQQPPALPRVIPPSPDASSLGKYGEIPVSLFTGTASVNIPLFELQSKTLSVPISLSYHGSGVKVEEFASWVGIGWSLNAGGVITRSIRGGLHDEEANGRLYADLPTAVELADPLVARDYAPGGSRDGEPDAYYYNFNGRSGQIMFDENGSFYTTSAEKIQFGQTISYSANRQWILTDEQGITYIFGGVEETSVNGQQIPTAWYLTKMISADGSDFIDFNYTQKSETTYVPSALTYVWHNSQGQIQTYEEEFPMGELGVQGDYTTGTYVSGYATLSEISSKKGKIVIEATASRTDFAGAKEVDKIKIYDTNNQILKLFDFSYSGNSDRIFLTSLTEVGSTGLTKPPYLFTYFDQAGLPPRSSLAQDFWGYFNGKFNQNLIPNLGSEYPMPGELTPADRTCDSVSMVKGTLKSITYPTGGKTEFEYEPNQFVNGILAFSAPTEIVASTINDENATSNSVTPYSTNARITISFNSFREPDNYPRPVVRLQRFENGVWSTPPGYIWQIPYPSLDNTFFDIDLTIEKEKPHRVYITTEGCPTPPCNTPQPSPYHYTTEVHFYAFDIAGSGMISKGGGLRIKAIRDYDVFNPTMPASTRKFEYAGGTLVSFPIYHRKYDRWLCKTKHPDFQACIEPVKIPLYTATSQSLVNLGTCQGGIVVYTIVKEIYGENGENGYSESWFTSSDLGYSYMASVPPYLPRTNTDFYDGKLAQQTTHHQNGQLLHKNWNLYLNGGFTNYKAVQGLKVLQTEYPSSFFHPGEGVAYVNGYYNIESKWVYLDSTSELSYVGGTAPVTVSTKYLYENPVHMQVTKKKTYSSEGKLIEVRSAYANDSPTETEMTPTIFSNLLSKNMIGIPLKTETWVEGSRKDGSIINYNTYPDGSLQTSSVQILEGANYKPRMRYNEYSGGNIQMVSKENDLKLSYIWGYNKALPIAEVKNAEIGPMSTNYSTTHYADQNITVNTSSDVALSASFEVPTNQIVAPTATVAIMGTNGPPSPFLTIILKRSDGTAVKTHNCKCYRQCLTYPRHLSVVLQCNRRCGKRI